MNGLTANTLFLLGAARRGSMVDNHLPVTVNELVDVSGVNHGLLHVITLHHGYVFVNNVYGKC